MFLLLLSVIICAAPGGNYHASPALSNAGTFTLQGQTTPRRISKVANSFPGADLGAKINAADKALGATAGEVLVQNGGLISTQVTISPGHTLRFEPGTYRLATELLWEGAVLLKSRTAVIGSGWDTIIVEPPRTGWTVFQSFEDIRSRPAHSGVDSDISITNLQIKGANPAVEGGVRQTISLGNCHRCLVENVWFNGTGVIGVQAGGNAIMGNYADDVKILKNQFTRVASQAAAVVNGNNVIIDGNTFKDSGRCCAQGMTAIDLEPNESRDIIRNIEITNNQIDSRDSALLHGNGILVQNGARTRDFGPVLVKGNTVSGGDLIPNSAGNVATGIYVVNVQDVTVVNNTIRRVAHCGIRLENSTRIYVANNKLISTGTGGILAFEIMNTTDSKIFDNVVAVDPNSPLGNSVIHETGASRNNQYKGNTNGRTALAPSIESR
ncbi:MAG: right-handed parallel beta-helix repeat-containing protein [bacterium]